MHWIGNKIGLDSLQRFLLFFNSSTFFICSAHLETQCRIHHFYFQAGHKQKSLCSFSLRGFLIRNPHELFHILFHKTFFMVMYCNMLEWCRRIAPCNYHIPFYTWSILNIPSTERYFLFTEEFNDNKRTWVDFGFS